MRVALIGVPGTKKTEVAVKVAEELGNDLIIVDGYADALAQTLGTYVNHQSPYLVNLEVAISREIGEQKLVAADRDYIICGTVVESLAYAGLAASRMARAPQTQEMQLKVLREMTNAQLLAFMLADTLVLRNEQFKYTHIFYLPVPQVANITIVGESEIDFDPDTVELDKTVQEVLKKYNLPLNRLVGSVEQKAGRILEVLRDSGD